MTEKDYSLLRPFDLEAAKAGGRMLNRTWFDGVCTYIAGPDANGWIATENEKGIFIFSAQTNLLMLPLCWVEGKPVYPDTTIERADNGWLVKWSADGKGWQDGAGNWSDGEMGFKVQWRRPKPVTRWLNVFATDYAVGRAKQYHALHTSRADADSACTHELRIDCIEITLPPFEPKK